VLCLTICSSKLCVQWLQ